MNRIISKLKRFWVAFILFVSLIGGFANSPAAYAVPTTPEADQYQLNQSDTQVKVSPGQAGDKAGESGGFLESVKEAAETVKEKLNLDEPLPQGTKDFLKQVRGEDVKIENPPMIGK